MKDSKPTLNLREFCLFEEDEVLPKMGNGNC